MNIVFRRVYSSPPIASNAEIAILYALFALGAEFGPAITSPSAHGRNYFELSMNALHLDDVYAEPTIETVEALALQAKWHFSTNQDQAGANRSFSFVGFTMRIAITVSLVSFSLHVSLILISRADRTSSVPPLANLYYTPHTPHTTLLPFSDRDPKLQGFYEEECRRRRRLWYELQAFEAWQVRTPTHSPVQALPLSKLTRPFQCLLYKRPMSCHTQYTDVEPPYDAEETFGSDPACMLNVVSPFLPD